MGDGYGPKGPFARQSMASCRHRCRLCSNRAPSRIERLFFTSTSELSFSETARFENNLPGPTNRYTQPYSNWQRRVHHDQRDPTCGSDAWVGDTGALFVVPFRPFWG